MRLMILHPEEWDAVAVHIVAACRRGGCEVEPDALRDQVNARREKTLFALADDRGVLGGGVFELAGDALHMHSFGGVAGTVSALPEILAHWLEVAQRMGCSRITLKGRRGWDKLLPALGFQSIDGFWEITNVIRS